MSDRIVQKINQWLSIAAQRRQRRVLWLCGERDTVVAAAETFLKYFYTSALENESVFWLGGTPCDGAVAVKRSHHNPMLGVDVAAVVVDACDGFDPDAIGQVGGALLGGGALLLLSPDPEQWPGYDDPDYQRYRAERPENYQMRGNFLRRLVNLLEVQTVDVFGWEEKEVEEGEGEEPLCLRWREPVLESPSVGGFAVAPLSIGAPIDAPDVANATPGQRKIIDAVMALQEQTSSVASLAARRGRGKSVALGFVASSLQAADHHVVVTSAHSDGSARLRQTALAAGGQDIRFVPADELLRERASCDVLIIDEAAALPVPMLRQLLSICPHCILGTTMYGYEGTGQGVRDKLLPELRRRGDFHEYSLASPLRWSEDDPLEYLVDALLLQDCAAPVVSVIQNVGAIGYREVKPEELEDEAFLGVVFGLLRQAHYQTRPSDLRHLLDVPYARLWVAELDDVSLPASQRLLAVLLVCEEGGHDASLAEAVAGGRRRPRGNLMAQALAFTSGDAAWVSHPSVRVMRIAVCEACRRKGVATRLIQACMAAMHERGFSYWGSSFGCEPELLAFWRQLGALPVHLGTHPDHASGSFNVIVAASFPGTSFSENIEALSAQLGRDIPARLERFMPDFDTESRDRLVAVTAPILGDVPGEEAQWQQRDRQLVERFIRGEIGLELSLPALERVGEAGGIDIGPVLRAVVVGLPDWAAVANSQSLSGKKAVIAALRRELAQNPAGTGVS